VPPMLEAAPEHFVACPYYATQDKN